MDSEDDTVSSSYNKANVPNHISLEFIRTYGEFEVLWDKGHKFYNNYKKRQEAYTILANVLKKCNEKVDLRCVRSYINSLRCNYRVQLQNIKASRQQDNDGKVTYEYIPTQWKFIELYKFLRRTEDLDPAIESALEEVMKSNGDKSKQHGKSATKKLLKQASCSVTSEQIYCDVDSYEYEISKSDDVVSKRIKLEENIPQDPLPEQTCLNNLPNTEEYVEKVYHSIGSNVESKLRRMSQKQRCYAKLLIDKVLLNGIRNNLSKDTDLCRLVYKD